MNRRNFLKLIPKTIIGLGLLNSNITPIFTEPVSVGPVGEFEYYVITHQWMWVSSPRLSAYIDNISIPEGY